MPPEPEDVSDQVAALFAERPSWLAPRAETPVGSLITAIVCPGCDRKVQLRERFRTTGVVEADIARYDFFSMTAFVECPGEDEPHPFVPA